MKGIPLSGRLEKRFVQALLMFVAACLTFLGPTYVLYVLERVGVPASFLIVIGFASLIAGLLLFAYLLTGEKWEIL